MSVQYAYSNQARKHDKAVLHCLQCAVFLQVILDDIIFEHKQLTMHT